MSRLPALIGLLQLFIDATLAIPPQLPLTPPSQPDIFPKSNHGRKLHGRFLQITDIHPDPFYKVYSDTDAASACHRSKGPAGFYGAETSDCDAPFSLVNATFQWINENLKDSIDFIVWTGDSARHDNDEEFPRSNKQVVGLNTMLVNKFREVFGDSHGSSYNDFVLPIVPTFGNNDILPHNIFSKGPNVWTRTYAQVWKDFIPEEQRHIFDRGGWFYVEVIPNKLAVFSMNTMYFFDSNSAVDGCASRREPGYEQMKWLRIQLEFMRRRGMKAILSGHVPPARNEAKYSWDETCWQKYALWMRQYRDVVVGSFFGHMNIDHFMLQDFEDIKIGSLDGTINSESTAEIFNDRDMSIKSTASYLEGLRKTWSKLPIAPSSGGKKGNGKNDNKGQENYYRKIGGEWGERFHVVHVAPSVVPNYFPTLRVFHYNTTGIESSEGSSMSSEDMEALVADLESEEFEVDEYDGEIDLEDDDYTDQRKKKKKKPKFVMPRPPSKSSPPGPAYSPQTLSVLGYTQYYANLTHINDDFNTTEVDPLARLEHFSFGAQPAWQGGKHRDKHPKHSHPQPRKFKYELEYDTRNRTDEFGMSRGFFVKDWLSLAARMGRFKPSSRAAAVGPLDQVDVDVDVDVGVDASGEEVDAEKMSDKKTWLTFIHRAFVGSKSMDELSDQFGHKS